MFAATPYAAIQNAVAMSDIQFNGTITFYFHHKEGWQVNDKISVSEERASVGHSQSVVARFPDFEAGEYHRGRR